MIKKKIIFLIIFIILLITSTGIVNGAIAEDVYSIGPNCIYDIMEGTMVNDLKAIMKLNENDKILNSSNQEQDNSVTISSGMKLKTIDGNEYTLVVKGDISEDGKVTPTDIMQLKLLMVGTNAEKTYDVYAMDVNDDNELTATDVLNIAQYVVEIKDNIINAKKIVMQEIIELEQSEEKNIEYKVVPVTASRKLTWESSNEEVISVDENGKIIPHKMGSATITANAENKKSASCNVTCGIKPTDIKLNSGEITLSKDGSGSNPKEFQLVPTLTPENANISSKITYSSSDTNVVTVSETGLVTAVGSGTARVTATTANEKSAYIDVTVKTSIKDFTIGLSADGYSYDDYVKDNTIYIAYPNTSTKKWNDGRKKKPCKLQVNIKTDSGDIPTNVTYTSSNERNLKATATGEIESTAQPSKEMLTTVRQASAKLTINCEGISKTYNVIIFCGSNVIGVSCDNGGWQSGTTNKGSGHFQKCLTCGQCHRFHSGGGGAVPKQDATHTVQCSLCGGWVHLD